MKTRQIITAVLLKAIRDSGESLYSIAKATGLNKSALGRFVSGKRSIRLDNADRLAAHFKLKLSKGR
jgi:transcriptional regulator with XRE-family HTH domain